MGDFAGGLLKYLARHPVPRLTIAGGVAQDEQAGAGASRPAFQARAAVDMASVGGTGTRDAGRRTRPRRPSPARPGWETGLRPWPGRRRWKPSDGSLRSRWTVGAVRPRGRCWLAVTIRGTAARRPVLVEGAVAEPVRVQHRADQHGGGALDHMGLPGQRWCRGYRGSILLLGPARVGDDRCRAVCAVGRQQGDHDVGDAGGLARCSTRVAPVAAKAASALARPAWRRPGPASRVSTTLCAISGAVSSTPQCGGGGGEGGHARA